MEDKSIKNNLETIKDLEKNQTCLFDNIKVPCLGHKKNKKTIDSHIFSEKSYLVRIKNKYNEVLVFEIRNERYYDLREKNQLESLLHRVKVSNYSNTRNILCNAHDTNIFNKIDNKQPFDPNNSQQCFQFALKAFLFDYIKTLHTSDPRISTGHTHFANAVNNLCLKYDESILSIFKDEYSADNWKIIETKVITLNKKCNFISSFSFFPIMYPKFNYGGWVKDKVYINIFPEGDRTVVIISYLKYSTYQYQCKKLIDYLSNLYENKKHRELEELLTRYILLYDLKVTYNIDYFNRLIQDEKRKEQFFYLSLFLRECRSNGELFKNLCRIHFSKMQLNLFNEYI